MVHGGVVRGERTWHVTMATVVGITRRLDPAPSADPLVEYDASFRSAAQAGEDIGTTPSSGWNATPLKYN